MAAQPRYMLREFYRSVLLSPELMCLSCANTAWNRAACRCSAKRRTDCHLFAGDMLNRLAPREAPRESRRSPQARSGL
jgi:hypothetical protein